MNTLMRTTALVRLSAIGVMLTMLSGCYGYNLDHRETIGSSSGDAQAVNRISQMRDPWPQAAWNKSIRHDGVRMQNAIDAYHEPHAKADPNAAAIADLANGPTTSEE